jgi:hypothetical protein
MLYMQNSDLNACVLFSDATTDELLSSSGGKLIIDAFSRLGIKPAADSPQPADGIPAQKPSLSAGYLICEKDVQILKIEGLTYTRALGDRPELKFTQKLTSEQSATSDLIPIEVRRRKLGLPAAEKFDAEKYYRVLDTKMLGKVLLYIPVCETTLTISRRFVCIFHTFLHF